MLGFGLLVACHPVEPLDLPDDPAATGVPVGVRTVETGGVTFEVWYPATDKVAEDAGEQVSLAPFIPASFTDRVGPVELAPFATIAVRDAAPRNVDAPVPVILFSHGFGGFRLQSVDYTTHLASRGYVVIAVDHPGRMMGDILPCLFSPPLEGCNLAFGDDPAPAQLTVAADWVASLPEDDPLATLVDVEHTGLTGHSAGGGSTGTLGGEDERYDALLPMAYGPEVARDVPMLTMGGSCDAVVTIDDVTAGEAASTDAQLLTIEGAGHLAFSDLCDLDLAGLAADTLDGRDDLNATIYNSLLSLGTDGCPERAPDPAVCDDDAYLDLDTSAAIVRGASTLFFDAELKGVGPGLEGWSAEHATLGD